MRYYNKVFLKSELFYMEFYLPFISLTEHIVNQNFNRKLGKHEDAIEIVNNDYILHCKNYFKKDILFYEHLSKYLVDDIGEFKCLDEYTFFKLRYYGNKFLNIANEIKNFFEEEKRKYKENKYPEAIITLSQFMFHDAKAVFKYNGSILQILYRTGQSERIFEFYGIEDWVEKEFMKMDSTLIVEELYESSKGVYVYNTLWNHEYIQGENYSELSIKFTGLLQVK